MRRQACCVAVQAVVQVLPSCGASMPSVKGGWLLHLTHTQPTSYRVFLKSAICSLLHLLLWGGKRTRCLTMLTSRSNAGAKKARRLACSAIAASPAVHVLMSHYCCAQVQASFLQDWLQPLRSQGLLGKMLIVHAHRQLLVLQSGPSCCHSQPCEGPNHCR
jgi:hypothetical protein